MSREARMTLGGPISIGLPSIAALILALGAGALQVLNEVVFGASTPWHVYISVALVFLAGIGISPLIGPAFRAALHLPMWLATVIGAVLAALYIVQLQVSMSSTAHAIVAAVITVAAALGFSPTVIKAPVEALNWRGPQPV